MMDENSAGFRSKEEEQAAEGYIAPNTDGENVEIPSTETEPLDAEIQNFRSMLESLKAELPSGPGDLRDYIESLDLGLEDIVKTKDMLASREIDDDDLRFHLPRLYLREELGLGSVSRKGREEKMSSYYGLLMQFDLIRSNIQSQIEQRHHLEPIIPSSHTPYNILFHDDTGPNHREITYDPDKHNTVGRCLAPGFSRNGKVLNRAFVTQLLYVKPRDPTTESNTTSALKTTLDNLRNQ